MRNHSDPITDEERYGIEPGDIVTVRKDDGTLVTYEVPRKPYRYTRGPWFIKDRDDNAQWLLSRVVGLTKCPCPCRRGGAT